MGLIITLQVKQMLNILAEFMCFCEVIAVMVRD